MSAAATVLSEAMETPEPDKRSYRFIRLSNNLTALLVSDPSIGGSDDGNAAVSSGCWPCLGQSAGIGDEAEDATVYMATRINTPT